MNTLKNKKLIKELLNNYKPNAQAKAVLAKTRLVLLVSPTSIGRNTIIENLVKTKRYRFLVSDTTRKIRFNNGVKEATGKEYWFISEDEFIDKLKAREYIEASVMHNQQLSGPSISEVEKAYNDKKIAITDTDPQGVRKLRKIKPDLMAIFVLPPSFSEWMSRLDKRGKMTRTEKKRRLISAKAELLDALSSRHYSYVINDKLQETVELVDKLINKKVPNNTYQTVAKELARKLLTEIDQFIV